MNFALTYLLGRFFYRLYDFFHHWYVDGSRLIARRFMDVFQSLDQTLALKVTLRYFFQPLYGDYTVVGRILGFVFRPARILIAVFVYAFLGVLFLALYVAWVLIPPFVLANAFTGL